MRELKESDFPLKFQGVTIELDSTNLLIEQDCRQGQERTRIPLFANGLIYFRNARGKEHTDWSWLSPEEQEVISFGSSTITKFVKEIASELDISVKELSRIINSIAIATAIKS